MKLTIIALLLSVTFNTSAQKNVNDTSYFMVGFIGTRNGNSSYGTIDLTVEGSALPKRKEVIEYVTSHNNRGVINIVVISIYRYKNKEEYDGWRN